MYFFFIKYLIMNMEINLVPTYTHVINFNF